MNTPRVQPGHLIMVIEKTQNIFAYGSMFKVVSPRHADNPNNIRATFLSGGLRSGGEFDASSDWYFSRHHIRLVTNKLTVVYYEGIWNSDK